MNQMQPQTSMNQAQTSIITKQHKNKHLILST
jgi:hypothetical protein